MSFQYGRNYPPKWPPPVPVRNELPPSNERFLWSSRMRSIPAQSNAPPTYPTAGNVHVPPPRQTLNHHPAPAFGFPPVNPNSVEPLHVPPVIHRAPAPTAFLQERHNDINLNFLPNSIGRSSTLPPSNNRNGSEFIPTQYNPGSSSWSMSHSPVHSPSINIPKNVFQDSAPSLNVSKLPFAEISQELEQSLERYANNDFPPQRNVLPPPPRYEPSQSQRSQPSRKEDPPDIPKVQLELEYMLLDLLKEAEEKEKGSVHVQQENVRRSRSPDRWSPSSDDSRLSGRSLSPRTHHYHRSSLPRSRPRDKHSRSYSRTRSRSPEPKSPPHRRPSYRRRPPPKPARHRSPSSSSGEDCSPSHNEKERQQRLQKLAKHVSQHKTSTQLAVKSRREKLYRQACYARQLEEEEEDACRTQNVYRPKIPPNPRMMSSWNMPPHMWPTPPVPESAYLSMSRYYQLAYSGYQRSPQKHRQAPTHEVAVISDAESERSVEMIPESEKDLEAFTVVDLISETSGDEHIAKELDFVSDEELVCEQETEPAVREACSSILHQIVNAVCCHERSKERVAHWLKNQPIENRDTPECSIVREVKECEIEMAELSSISSEDELECGDGDTVNCGSPTEGDACGDVLEQGDAVSASREDETGDLSSISEKDWHSRGSGDGESRIDASLPAPQETSLNDEIPDTEEFHIIDDLESNVESQSGGALSVVSDEDFV